MFNTYFSKKIMKGGEKMKTLTILLIGLMVLSVPCLGFAAISLTVNASVIAGTNLGPHVLLKCTGYNYNQGGDPFVQCANQGTSTSLAFGQLTNQLYNSSGQPTEGAGCFYAKEFFIVYLYPDAWGGKGYDLKQTAGTFSAEIANSVVMTPVYSPDDKYSGQTTGQGNLITGETIGNPVLAKNGGQILKAKRPRIVRAEYGIPPLPDPTVPTDTRPSGWSEVPLTTAAGTYSGSVQITVTEWQ